MPRPKKPTVAQLAAEHDLTTADRIASPGPHAGALLASLPNYRIAPQGFFAAARFNGVRVLKKTYKKDGETRSIVAIQFPDSAPPSRAEKNFLEALDTVDQDDRDRQKFSYQHGFWLRYSRPGESPGGNVIDGQRIAERIGHARGQSR